MLTNASGGSELSRCAGDLPLRLLFRGRGLGDACLVLGAGRLQLADCRVQQGRFLLQLRALGRLLALALDGLAKALLGIALAPAPIGLLARCSAEPLAIGRGLARPGRRLGAFFGDGGRGLAWALLAALLLNLRWPWVQGLTRAERLHWVGLTLVCLLATFAASLYEEVGERREDAEDREEVGNEDEATDADACGLEQAQRDERVRDARFDEPADAFDDPHDLTVAVDVHGIGAAVAVGVDPALDDASGAVEPGDALRAAVALDLQHVEFDHVAITGPVAVADLVAHHGPNPARLVLLLQLTGGRRTDDAPAGVTAAR